MNNWTYVDVVRMNRLVTGPTEDQIIHNLMETWRHSRFSHYYDDLTDSSAQSIITIHNIPHLHAEHSLRVSLQRAEEQAVLGISDADGAVVGAH